MQLYFLVILTDIMLMKKYFYNESVSELHTNKRNILRGGHYFDKNHVSRDIAIETILK